MKRRGVPVLSVVVPSIVLFAAWATRAKATEPGIAELLTTQALRPGEVEDGEGGSAQAVLRDTLSFGSYEVRGDGLKYAVLGRVWTWDSGLEDPLEGWTSVDLTVNLRDYWRQMTEARWIAEGNPGAWPPMNGAGYALCGASQAHADSLGWVSGIGYGNDWCQRLTSPELIYDGSGGVTLSFHYFSETEEDQDLSQLLLEVGSIERFLNSPGFSGRIGIDADGTVAPAIYAIIISQLQLGGGPDPAPFRIRFEFRSDPAVSDEDAANGWSAHHGAIGVDDISFQGNLVGGDVAYDFEQDLQGWTAERCPGAGSFLGVAPLSQYWIQDPCNSGLLSGNVLEMHDEFQRHPGDDDPVGQHEMAYSCILDRKSDIGDPAYLDYNHIQAEWDQYSEMPWESGVFYRPGWSYYPYEDPLGHLGWSPRVGRTTFLYLGSSSLAAVMRDVGTEWGLPPTASG